VSPLIRENRLWKGATGNTPDMVFGVPKGFPVSEADRLKAERLGYPSTDERDFTRLGNSCWFTNLEHGRRHEPMQLMSEADNIKFSRHKEVRGEGYKRYDNYDGIDVPFTDAIPGDHDGLMGVPISFLDRYNPDQFEILGITQSWDDDAGLKLRTYPTQTQISASGERSVVGKLNDGAAIRVSETPQSTHYEVDGALFVKPYCRILICRKGTS